MNKSESKYFSCFPQDTRDIWDKINGNELNELILITQDYLRPYLQFISDNRKVYRAAFRNPNNMQANIRYENLKQYNLEPILKKFGVPDKFQQYYIVYYIEGITAIINYVPDISVAENEAVMVREAGNVATGQVTYAVRDTMIDDKEIHQGDFMGIGDKGILSVGTDLQTVAYEMIQSMMKEDYNLISIYYGEEVEESRAQELADKVKAAFGDCDIELQFGGQPIYSYIVSAE